MDEREGSAKLFNRIARPYSWFFRSQVKFYRACFDAGRSFLPDPAGKQALDLGCGTGAFATVLKGEGWDVRGIDAAEKMVAKARRVGIDASVGDVLAGLPLADKSFDLVSAAYVVHGLEREDRAAFFREAGRLSRGLVLFHDYSGRRRLLTDFIERLEGGGYFEFIETGAEEMRLAFSNVRVLETSESSSWYLCTP